MTLVRQVFQVLILVLLVNATGSASGPLGTTMELEAFIDRIVGERLSVAGIAGATVAVVSDGEIVLSKGYGHANLDEQTEVDPEGTLFRVGSISKLFVWTAVMQLVEQGKLDLDTDVNAYLDFTLPPGPRGTSGEPDRPITLTHLMSHTAGFEDVGAGLFFLTPDRMLPLEDYLRNHMPARVFPAGKLAAYSNYGSALGGYIVERIAGMPFSQYVEQNILLPLGMTRSSFQQPVPESLAPSVARGYRFVDGEVYEGGFAYALEPAGGMSSTAADMARFMLAHLQAGSLDGQQILRPETAHRMHGHLISQHPSLDGSAHGFFDATINGHRIIYHPGSVLLFNSAVYLLPEENVGLFVSFNGGGFTDPSTLFYAFMDRYFPAEPQPALVPKDGDLARARVFAGEYHVNRRSFTTDESLLTLLDTLQIAVDDHGYLLATHYGETDRFVEVADGIYRNVNARSNSDPYGAFRTLVFEKDSSGQIYLMSDGPMSYTKAPGYATSGFTLATVLLTVVLLVSAPITWVLQIMVQRLKRRASFRAKLSGWARGITTVFVLVMVVFLGGVLAVTGDMEPAYGIPKSFFGIEPASSQLLYVLPMLLVIIGVAMLIFTVVAWRKSFWRIAGRIQYTVVTLAALALLTVLKYWSVI